ncbi:MAG TPA: class I tRNA ligase family protein [Acidimicrobiales bacterium]|nr:class I tRNA ligase family protein [Acidimicrobiales bacterium]HMS87500.1 class I tRNA ligase family protein [Acidimicrobiales bacterium]HRA35717.1 class I tRNA ligase family protein [Acidimicrobiales bacterium]
MLIRLGGQDLAIVGRARVYICGITPYDATHVGHAATFVWSDVAVRFLRLAGHEVQVTRNITDVDDSLLTRARETGTPWRTLATRQTYQFEDDMARLGVSTPTFEPQAHNYVGEVIELTQGLLDLGHAYERGGTVYARHPGVAEQAGLSEAEALALASERGEDPTDAGKDHPLDTPLWRRVTSDDEGPGWDSPWGPGRPGWHVECSAMALTTLGPGLDLHCGGADLAFPHHAFEAAHAEAVTGVTPFARSWIRAGAVHYQGQKMAKSIGNLVMVRDLLADHTAAALRLLVCDRRWWDDWTFDAADLAAAEDRVAALRTAAIDGPGGDEARTRVVAALADDLDVPTALAVAEAEGGAAAEAVVTVLGLHPFEPTSRTSMLPNP